MDLARDQIAVQFDRSGRSLTVYVSGELDAGVSPKLARDVIEQCTNLDHLTIDLSEVTFCDSSGLSAFLSVHHHASEAGIDFDLLAPQPVVMNVLTTTQLNTVIHIRK